MDQMQSQSHSKNYPTPPIPPVHYSTIPTSEYESLLHAAHSYSLLCHWILKNAPQDVGENAEHTIEEEGAAIAVRLMEETLQLRRVIDELAQTVVNQNLQVVSQVVDNNQRLLKTLVGDRAPDLFLRAQEDARMIQNEIRNLRSH